MISFIIYFLVCLVIAPIVTRFPFFNGVGDRDYIYDEQYACPQGNPAGISSEALAIYGVFALFSGILEIIFYLKVAYYVGHINPPTTYPIEQTTGTLMQ
jgi:hypothetical protein